MDQLRPPGPLPPKRRTLNDIMEGLWDEEGRMDPKNWSDELISKYKQLDDILEESTGYRMGAPSTINRQDRHLREFRVQCVAHYKRTGRVHELDQTVADADVADSDANDRLFFPEDRNVLFGLVKVYLIVMIQHLEPRSKKDEHVRLSTITARRWSLLYWIYHKLESPPSFALFRARTNQALYLAAKICGVNTTRNKKTYFGRHEFMFLMDFDLGITPNVEVAQNFHLSWVLGLVCGVRPGAMGTARLRPNNFLRWKNIRLRRVLGSRKGQFEVTITFPYMKGYNDKMQEGDDELDGQLELTVRGPFNADNLPLSAPHRLLAILLTRKMLADHTTPKQLLNGQEVNIRIKEEALDKPILLKATARGLGLVQDEPATGEALSDYLQLRAVKAGFPKSSTMYSWRRKAGTTMDRVAGREKARAFLYHTSTSRSFEKAYNQGHFDLDVGAIALGEDHEAGGQAMAVESSAVLYRAALKLSQRQQEEYIQDYVNNNLDVNTPNAALLKRRLRRYARRALYDEADRLSELHLSKEELQKRAKAMMSRSALAESIARRVKERIEQRNAMKLDDEDEEEEEEEDDDDDEVFYDLGDDLGVNFGDEGEDYNNPDRENVPEPIPQSENHQDGVDKVTIDTDLPVDADKDAPPFDEAVEIFFDIMAEKGVPSGLERQCPECIADGTIDPADRFKFYRNNYYLERHLESSIHEPYKKWWRKVKALHDRKGKDMPCPYDEGCKTTFPDVAALVAHCKKRFKHGEADPHYAGLVEEGWSLPDFKKKRRSPSKEATKRKSYTRQFFEESGKLPQLEPLQTARPAKIPGYVKQTGFVMVGPQAVDPVEDFRNRMNSHGLLGTAITVGIGDQPEQFPSLSLEDYRNEMQSKGFLGKFITFGDQPPLPGRNATLTDLIDNIPGETKEILEQMGTPIDTLLFTGKYRAPEF